MKPPQPDPAFEISLRPPAFAEFTGAALPLRFGSWFQHLGLNPGMWMPAKTGPGYEHNIQLKVFDQFRATTNVYSGTGMVKKTW